MLIDERKPSRFGEVCVEAERFLLQAVSEGFAVNLQDLCGEELSEAELLGLSGSSGLTGQLQTLRRALYHKYVQEVAALKEQHSSELRRLREEQRSKRRDLNGVVVGSGGSESLAVVNHLPEEEEELHQHRLEEEVAKVSGDDQRTLRASSFESSLDDVGELSVLPTGHRSDVSGVRTEDGADSNQEAGRPDKQLHADSAERGRSGDGGGADAQSFPFCP